MKVIFSGRTTMKKNLAVAVLVLTNLAAGVFAQVMPKPEERRTLTQVMDRALTNAEKEFLSAAEAMPEEKFGYAPTDGEFKGVRTFAGQIKHVAASNYEFGGVILQEKPPLDFGGEEGPASIKTKAEILKFLKDSFAYMHKAIAALNEQNATESIKSPWGQNTVTRLGITSLTVAHCFDHYGQMVVYLRHNGIIPPASR
jgi:uncharacterized damage-inducible protein DinB